MPFRRAAKPAADRREKRQSTLVPGALIGSITGDPRDPSLVHIRIKRRSAAKIEHTIAAELGLAPGIELTQSLIDGILTGVARTDARYWALNTIARAATSKGALVAKLMQKGRGRVSAQLATSIADDLEAKGFLNDRHYAEALVASELRRKPAGPRLLEMKLRTKRIDPKLAREIVAAAIADQTAQTEHRRRTRAADDEPAASVRADREPALALARKKFRTLGHRVDKPTASRRIYGLLARRGFDPETCREVTQAVLKSSDLA